MAAVVKTYAPPLTVSFPNLDGLRFIAFFLVFLAHGFQEIESRFDEGSILRKALFDLGGVGVSFFFVLSGFLISFLILAEIENRGKVNVGAFYVRRTLRIWPLYYAVLGYAFVITPLLVTFNNWLKSDGIGGTSEKIILLLTGLIAYQGAGEWVWYATFLSNFEVMRLLQINSGSMLTDITWSIAIEEQFYLSWPLWFRFVSKKFYLYIFLFIILGSAMFRAFNADNPSILYFHTFAVISDMAIGGLAAYLAMKRTGFTEFFARLPKAAIVVVYFVGASLILFDKWLFVNAPLIVLQRIVFASFFAFIVMEQNYARHSVVKMSAFRTISRLGIYTYGLYLLHPIGIKIVERLVQIFRFNESSLDISIVGGAVALALTILFAVTSYHLFEKPFLSLKSRFAYVKR